MKSFSVTTTVEPPARLAFVDLTDDLWRAVKDSGATDGLALAFVLHTTCSLVINEWEEGLQEDLKRKLEGIAPPGNSYAHDDLRRRTQNLVQDERRNGHSHLAQMLVGATSQTIPVQGGEPVLGKWQRLFMIELDEPKPRSVIWQVIGI